jgi:hypothetical protein
MNPVPESPETIELQLEWLRIGKRKAVLLTPGTPMPDLDVRHGLAVLLIPQGVLVYRHADWHHQAELVQEVSFSLGKLLDYGIEAKPERTDEVVTIRNRNGVEKQAVATDAEHLPDVLAAANEMADKTDTVHQEDGRQVIADRLRCLDARELKVRPYHAESDALALAAAAKADSHAPLNPTHVIERDGEIVGYFGVNSLPLYRLWFHSQKMSASASTRLLFMIENHFRMAGVGIIGTVINVGSPFYPCAPRGGYLECIGDRLFLKQL